MSIMGLGHNTNKRLYGLITALGRSYSLVRGFWPGLFRQPLSLACFCPKKPGKVATTREKGDMTVDKSVPRNRVGRLFRASD
jgi:hypothetical protein